VLRWSHADFAVTTREGEELVVPKGQIVAASPAVANRLPHVFRDPDAYDPDRFAPGRSEDKAAGADCQALRDVNFNRWFVVIMNKLEAAL
jgi:sterol 14-demethylase